MKIVDDDETNDGEKLHLLWKALKRKLTSQTIFKKNCEEQTNIIAAQIPTK